MDIREKWGKKYPYAVSNWENNWEDVSPFFQFPDFKSLNIPIQNFELSFAPTVMLSISLYPSVVTPRQCTMPRARRQAWTRWWTSGRNGEKNIPMPGISLGTAALLHCALPQAFLFMVLQILCQPLSVEDGELANHLVPVAVALGPFLCHVQAWGGSPHEKSSQDALFLVQKSLTFLYRTIEIGNTIIRKIKQIIGAEG